MKNNRILFIERLKREIQYIKYRTRNKDYLTGFYQTYYMLFNSHDDLKKNYYENLN